MSIVKRFRDFSSGFLVTSTQRISNILYLLKNNHVIFTLLHGETIYKTRIIKIERNQAVLYVPDFEHKLENSGNIYFEILNGYYYSEIKIITPTIDQIVIDFPHELFCLKDRKYPRVKFDDLFIRFDLLYSTIFLSKGVEIDLHNKYPYLLEEVTKDMPSLKLIYNILISKIKEIAHDFSIVMFRKKPADMYTLYEKILLKTQKTILIEDVTKTESYIHELPSSSLINLFDYHNKQVSKLGELEASREIHELRKKDSKEFLISYLMSPLHIYQNTIGYVRIETNQFQKYRIHRHLAEDFHSICSIFSYGLTKINIWTSYFIQEGVKTRILNLSINGMLIEIFDQVLFEYLRNFRRIKIILPIFGKELNLSCEIKRLFKKGGGYYLGVYIFHGAPGDFQLLENYINDNLQYNFF